MKSKIYKAIETEFCKALANTRQGVTDAMNAAPCFLGSEKHFEMTEKAVKAAIKEQKTKTPPESIYVALDYIIVHEFDDFQENPSTGHVYYHALVGLHGKKYADMELEIAKKELKLKEEGTYEEYLRNL